MKDKGAADHIMLTHWDRMTHMCVSKLTIIGSDNDLSPDRRQAVIYINAGLFLIGPLGANFFEILIEILTFSLKKMRMKVSSAKRRPFCLGLNVLTPWLLMTVRRRRNGLWHQQPWYWQILRFVSAMERLAIQPRNSWGFKCVTYSNSKICAKC